MHMNVVETEVTEALTSESRRATHSGTGDGSGIAVAISLRVFTLIRTGRPAVGGGVVGL